MTQMLFMYAFPQTLFYKILLCYSLPDKSVDSQWSIFGCSESLQMVSYLHRTCHPPLLQQTPWRSAAPRVLFRR